MARSEARKYTNRLLDLIDEGMLDARSVVQHALGHLSEEDVKQLCEANEYVELMFPDEQQAEEEPESVADQIRRDRLAWLTP